MFGLGLWKDVGVKNRVCSFVSVDEVMLCDVFSRWLLLNVLCNVCVVGFSMKNAFFMKFEQHVTNGSFNWWSSDSHFLE